MSDTVTDTAPIDQASNGHAHAVAPIRLSGAEKVRRHRERQRRGIVATVPVEVHENCLEMLAAGGQTTVEALRSDRQLLAATAARALKHLGRYFAETGGLPRVQPRVPGGTAA
jgi:hypothetical protein